MYMSPLPLLVVLAVKVLIVTSRAEKRGVCNDSNFTIVSVSMDICERIRIILQPCLQKYHHIWQSHSGKNETTS